MAFIHEHFLLGNETARRLFHETARELPLIDYHGHLNPADIASDRRFNDLAEIWLEGDHYKWRAMRANGIDERFCTGDAPPKEKFMAWAATVPHTLRNPLYHWTHLELQRYFGIDELLNEKSAARIWDRANARLQDERLSARGILKAFRVEVLCTTDDPADDLASHRAIAASDLKTKVFPTFRPDAVLRIGNAKFFNGYVDRLGRAADVSIVSFDDLLSALERRHDAFHAVGCRLSDHGLAALPDRYAADGEIRNIFDKARGGGQISADEVESFSAAVMLHCGRLDAAKGWTKQLHLGALRNNSSRAMKAIGPDGGFDSIGDRPQAESLARFLDRLDRDGALPKTVIYNLNPADNYVIAAMAGNFQDGKTAGKIQFGSGWWFLDQKEGMTWQLNTLSNLGLLSHFVGMVTDSRSFMSFPRHEYFRRVLCHVIGEDVGKGELPGDQDLLSGYVRRICYENARGYFNFPLPKLAVSLEPRANRLS